jgi:serine phosphatase RsbU (regulator of sigma subunit)
MKKYFLAVEGALPGRRAFAIVDGLRIGRSTDNDIALSGYDVSRRHAVIRVVGGKPVLKDLGSGNGTSVNGERVDQITLANGDRIRIGSVYMKVFEGEPPVETEHQKQTVINAVATSQSLTALLERKQGRMSASEVNLIRALKQELDKGREIQRDFLPRTLPELESWEISACFQPAMRVAGDFYDFFLLPGGLLALVIADVCDKGVGAAQFVSVIRTLLRLFSGEIKMEYHSAADANRRPGHSDGSPSEQDRVRIKALQAVSMTNDYIVREHGDLCMYATLFFGVLDPMNGQLSYINAGHEPLFVLNPDGTHTTLKPKGLPVGMQPGEKDFDIQNVRLEAGQILLGYTDGLIDAETEDGKLFSRKRLVSILQKPFPSATGLIEHLKSELNRHLRGANQSDDITMIAIQRKAV